MTLMSPFRLPVRKLIYLCLLSLATVILVSNHYGCRVKVDLGEMVRQNPVQYASDGKHSYPYHRNMPLLFIGGMPRSGTTLMRVMLDAHPEIRCGEETRVVPRMLGLKTYWTRSGREYNRMYAAGVNEKVLTSAIAEFILEVMAKHAEPAPRLCNKDPFNLRSAVDLLQMFPNCKFILMVRDGRAVVHSIVSREVTISGFDITSYRDCLEKWNAAIESMYMQCVSVGFERCLPVYYEQLVLHPEAMMRKILGFLDVPWDDSVLHHEQHINKPGGASLSSVEKSTDQVVKPVNLEALTAWVKHFPTELRYSVRYLAPMLVRLGYDPDAYPPNYGNADSFVANNTFSVRSNQQYWLQQAMAALHLSKVKEPTVEEDDELGSDLMQQQATQAPRGGTVAFRPQTLPIIVTRTSQTKAMETLASQWSSVVDRTAASTTNSIPPDQR